MHIENDKMTVFKGASAPMRAGQRSFPGHPRHAIVQRLQQTRLPS